MNKVIVHKKEKTSDEDESAEDRAICIKPHKPRIERVGDNLFIWRIPRRKEVHNG